MGFFVSLSRYTHCVIFCRMNNFWVNQPGTDFFILVLFFLWLVAALLLRRIPSVLYWIYEGIKHRRMEEFTAYVKRFTHPAWLNMTIHTMEALSFGMAFFVYYRLRGEIALSDYKASILLFAFISLSVGGFFLIRRLIYRKLGGLFLPAERFQRFFQMYHLLETLFVILLIIPVTLLWIAPTAQAACYMVLGLFLLWRLAVCWETLSVAERSVIGIIHLFLYLCAHELMPFIYLYYGIDYIVAIHGYLTLFP